MLRAGLLQIYGKPRRPQAKGRFEWKAWIKACDGCAQVYLRDRTDQRSRERLLEVLASLEERGGIARIFGRDEIDKLHLGKKIDYVLEAKPGYYFTNRLYGNIMEPTDDRHLASHGYLPDQEGYTPLFLAAGAGIRRGVEMSSIRMIDFAPTLAALLGFEMPTAEGRILREILEE